LKVFDKIEDDVMMWRMGYPHSPCLEVLILLIVEVVGINASSYAVCAFEDMDAVACTSEKEGSVETCHSTSNNSDREARCNLKSLG